jgi:hypothetical protein
VDDDDNNNSQINKVDQGWFACALFLPGVRGCLEREEMVSPFLSVQRRCIFDPDVILESLSDGGSYIVGGNDVGL